jgi:hypothetical protein
MRSGKGSVNRFWASFSVLGLKIQWKFAVNFFTANYPYQDTTMQILLEIKEKSETSHPPTNFKHQPIHTLLLKLEFLLEFKTFWSKVNGCKKNYEEGLSFFSTHLLNLMVLIF